MLESLAADAVKDGDLDLAVLVAHDRRIDLPARAKRIGVTPGGDEAALVAECRRADWTLIVAPETDGILRARVQAVRSAGGRVLAADDRAIDTAGDKQVTIDALAAAGLPVPAGRSLAPGESPPPGFPLPAVRKPRIGCGCDGFEIACAPLQTTAAVPTRLEAFVPGMPVGVSLLCGTAGTIPLPPMRQVFSHAGPLRYLGGDPLADETLAARATRLAGRAAAALGVTAGWLGVDMILGDRPDGRGDRVLEVNPRVTTSIVGLSGLFASSLVSAMIGAASGRGVALVRAAHPGPAAGGFRLPGG